MSDTLDILSLIVEQSKAHNDISDEAIDKALAMPKGTPLPKELEYIRLLPNSFWFQWRELSERERCFLIAATKHAFWKGKNNNE